MNKKNTESRSFVSLTFAILIVATVLRVLFLEWKSTHFDEGINGHFVMQIWEHGFFKYDPSNFHGPLYFYYLHFAEILMGRGIFTFRFANALLSVLVVFMTAKHFRFVGKSAYWAAAVLAVSPAFVFYGRYAIHETLLILSQVLFSYGFLKWREAGGKSAVIYLAAGLFVSLATKETFFIFNGTWLIAWFLVRAFDRVAPEAMKLKTAIPTAKDVGGKKQWVYASLGGLVAVLILYSAFFMDPDGIKNMFRAFTFWTKTGTGATGHEKRFTYWLMLLTRYEWPLLFALLFAPIAALFGSLWMRVFTLAGFGLWLAYSLIPYKTPWCVIGFWPLAFAFGFLMTETTSKLRARSMPAIGIVLIFISLLTSLRLNFRDYHNNSDPYVYVQSRPDLIQVKALIDSRIALNPEDRAMKIQIALSDTWPLPWLFNRYPETLFLNSTPSTPVPDARIILADAPRALEIQPLLARRYIKRSFQIRDAYLPGVAYFDFEFFSADFPGPQEVVGGKPQ